MVWLSSTHGETASASGPQEGLPRRAALPSSQLLRGSVRVLAQADQVHHGNRQWRSDEEKSEEESHVSPSVRVETQRTPVLWDPPDVQASMPECRIRFAPTIEPSCLEGRSSLGSAHGGPFEFGVSRPWHNQSAAVQRILGRTLDAHFKCLKRIR